MQDIINFKLKFYCFKEEKLMNKKILIVDDSPLIHNLIKRAVEKSGNIVCGDAKNGKEGLELYKKLLPDVTFMDINMPVMDGIEAVRKIREISAYAVIIMLTAVGDEETIKIATEIGVSAFLNKPFDDYKLISALANL
jgi:two-component system chemotaxis response regulator CheY